MSWDVRVPFLVSLVLFNIMQVVTTNDNSPRHLGTVASTRENTTPDGDVASEWALLVNVCSFDSISGGLESQPNTLPEAIASLSRPLSLPCLL